MGSEGAFVIKISACFLSVTAFLTAVLIYRSTVSMGFPDGHLTEFEIAIKPLLIGYGILAVCIGILFYALTGFSTKSYS